MRAPPRVRLLGHVGRLRDDVPSPSAPDGAAPLACVWEGAVDGPTVARVIAAAIHLGALPCDVDGVPHRATPGACWYDAGTGVLVVELREALRAVA
ncbi:MAG: hypothetical protein P1P87_12525 [Trueperaceae bacterium]|nr:hypothetical protein [Trueperaceae bacterium]